ncbi:hypothetical protein RUM44_004078 [Polyplax serrata]|uniref:Uncharacterized protein n=1 Tax=Polyplax serrata TaxID=468196 RepID=A0ABR1B1S9_POLSC
MYPFSAGSTYPYPMLSPEMSQVPASWARGDGWKRIGGAPRANFSSENRRKKVVDKRNGGRVHTPGMYPISAGTGFRSPYPTSLPISSTTLPSDFYRFSPTSLLPGHPGLSPHGHHSLSSHPAIVTPGPKQELGHHTQSDHNHRDAEPFDEAPGKSNWFTEQPTERSTELTKNCFIRSCLGMRQMGLQTMNSHFFCCRGKGNFEKLENLTDGKATLSTLGLLGRGRRVGGSLRREKRKRWARGVRGGGARGTRAEEAPKRKRQKEDGRE